MISDRFMKLALVTVPCTAMSTLSAATAHAEPADPTGRRSGHGVNEWWNEVRAWCTGGQGQVRAVAVCRDHLATWTLYGPWKNVPNMHPNYWSAVRCQSGLELASWRHETRRS
ncbi:hypothetical protein ACWEKT_40650 [Nocardia takedensis]